MLTFKCERARTFMTGRDKERETGTERELDKKDNNEQRKKG